METRGDTFIGLRPPQDSTDRHTPATQGGGDSSISLNALWSLFNHSGIDTTLINLHSVDEAKRSASEQIASKL